jgi:hypothetical protein
VNQTLDCELNIPTASNKELVKRKAVVIHLPSGYFSSIFQAAGIPFQTHKLGSKTACWNLQHRQ